jgi:hypothetical protein
MQPEMIRKVTGNSFIYPKALRRYCEKRGGKEKQKCYKKPNSPHWGKPLQAQFIVESLNLS